MTNNKKIIFLASYPKSGNTWLRSIISSLIYNQGNFHFEDLKNHPNQRSSLAISNLEKEINSMIKYRSSALLSKYQPKSSLKVGNINDKPLLVKWLSK